MGVVGDDLITVSFFSTGDCFAFFDSVIFDFASIFPGFALFASFFLGFASFAGGAIIFSPSCLVAGGASIGFLGSSSRFSSFSILPISFFMISFFASFCSFLSFTSFISTSIFLFSNAFLTFASGLPTGCGCLVGMIVGVPWGATRAGKSSPPLITFISGDSFFSFFASPIFLAGSLSVMRLNFCLAGLSRKVANEADGERLFAEHTGCLRNSRCFNRSKPSKILGWGVLPGNRILVIVSSGLAGCQTSMAHIETRF